MIQEKLNELESLITVPDVNKESEQSINAMKMLNILVELRGLVKNCNIPCVSVLLPVDNDITIFADYITKYFEWYRNDDLYKDKNSGEVLPQSVIYEKWKGNKR